jgi:hypothetical protein
VVSAPWAQKPEATFDLGKAEGATVCAVPRPGRWSWGAPPSLQAVEPPVAWPLIVGKLEARGKVLLAKGRLRFLLQCVPGLPRRPPLTDFKTAGRIFAGVEWLMRVGTCPLPGIGRMGGGSTERKFSGKEQGT